LNGCNVFSKIELVKGYHQIPAAAADIPKMVIIMQFGLLEYLFMLFGLSNAAQAFQRMMDHTTDGLEDVFAYVDDSRVGSLDMFAYMDDSHVGSPDRQTHLLHLESFSTALATNGLTINLEKCVLHFPLWRFLAT
jgi:hypothetical protein